MNSNELVYRASFFSNHLAMVNARILSFDSVEDVVDHDEIHVVSSNDYYPNFVMKEQEHIHMEQVELMIDYSLEEKNT